MTEDDGKKNSAMRALLILFQQAKSEATLMASREIRRDKGKLRAYCHAFAMRRCRDEYQIIIRAALKFADGENEDSARATREICHSILHFK